MDLKTPLDLLAHNIYVGILSATAAKQIGVDPAANQEVLFEQLTGSNGPYANQVFWRGVRICGIMDIGPSGIYDTKTLRSLASEKAPS